MKASVVKYFPVVILVIVNKVFQLLRLWIRCYCGLQWPLKWRLSRLVISSLRRLSQEEYQKIFQMYLETSLRRNVKFSPWVSWRSSVDETRVWKPFSNNFQGCCCLKALQQYFPRVLFESPSVIISKGAVWKPFSNNFQGCCLISTFVKTKFVHSVSF